MLGRGDGDRRHRCRKALDCCSPSSPASSVVFLRSWTLSHGRKKQESGLSSPFPSHSPQDTSAPTCPCQLPAYPGEKLVKKRPETSKKQGLVQGLPPAHWLCDSGQVMLHLGPWFPQHQVGALLPGSHDEMESQCAAATGTVLGELQRAAPSPPGHCGLPPVCIQCPQRRK